MMTIILECVECGKIMEFEVEFDDYMAWLDGSLAQRAFPYLSADQREMLISSLCEDCFKKLLT